jgi:hypothetical protein
MMTRTFSRWVQSMVTVLANGVDEVLGDLFEGFVAEDLDGAVVDFEGVVEGPKVATLIFGPI